MSPFLQTPPNRHAACVLAGLALALLSAWAPARAQTLDPASINRVDAPPCVPLIGAPGQPVSQLCEANGNASIRGGGSSLNATGVMRGEALAQVDFEAVSRDAGPLAVWPDGLVWLGSWTPGAALPVELRLSTSAQADNDWFRSGAGSVIGQADFLAGSGLAGLRWLDAAGQDISDQVQWSWQFGVTPVPEPASALLLGLAAMAGRARRRVAGRSAAVGLGLGLVAASASAEWTYFPRQAVQSEVHDLYAANGPVVDRQLLNSNTTGSLTAERWRAGTTDFSQGGLAHSRYHWVNESLVAGTSALARSDAGHNGFARSSLQSSFRVGVWLYGPNDGFSQILWTDMMVLAGCLSDDGCVFNISFLHQTQGRFSYANSSGDREASFSERVTLRSITPFNTFEQRVGGDVRLRLRNNQSVAEVSASGDWSAGDLQAFGPTSASQLGLFPTGDARNALDDPRGDLQGWNFRHSEVLTVPVRFRATDFFGSLGAVQLVGRVDVGFEQQATAGIGPFVFSSSTLSVDFADTSTFSFSSITDASGVVDFSQTRASLISTPVPEPHAAWLALGGLALLWARRKVQRG
jgi:MYXO-CTERM domain-containing protein